MRIILITIITFFLYILPASPVSAASIRIERPDILTPPDAVTIRSIVKFVIDSLITIGIILSLVYLLIGEIKVIVSGGDKSHVESAKNHIFAVIVGAVIILLSFVILNIVFNLAGLPGLPTSLPIPTLTSAI